MTKEKTIHLNCVELLIKYDYQPEEKEDGYVRIKEEYTIEDIIHNDESIAVLLDDRLDDEIINLLK